MKHHYFRLLMVLLFQLSLLLWAGRPLAADASLNVEAQKHFDAGLLYIDDPSGPKWDEALKAFRAAYAQSPNWKLMNNIGLCALKLERDGEAIEAYKTYLAHGGEQGLTAKQHKQIENDVAMLSASLVTVLVEVAPREALLVDERRTAQGKVVLNQYPITGGQLSIGIHPGVHHFTITAKGYAPYDATLVTEPATKHRLQAKLQQAQLNEAALPPAPSTAKPVPAPLSPTAAGDANAGDPAVIAKPDGRKLSTPFYLSLIGTGVFAVAATTTGVVTASRASDFNSSHDRAERHRIAESGRTYSLLTDIGVGAAVVCAGAATYFYITAPRDRTELPNQSRLALLPTIQLSGGGLIVSGSY